MSTKVTIKMSLKNELDEKLTASNKSLQNTANDAKAFWVGYNQAIQDLLSRFFPAHQNDQLNQKEAK